MGHSSIQVTADVYGHLIPGANIPYGLDSERELCQSATPARPQLKPDEEEDSTGPMEVFESSGIKDGERGRNRTFNLLIKSCKSDDGNKADQQFGPADSGEERQD